MARVRDIEIDEVSKDLRETYRRFTELGPFRNQVRVFAHRPPALRHIMGMLLELAEEEVLPKRYLEIALVAVSTLNECRYCVAHHAPRLTDQGLPPETVARILERDCPGLDDVDRLVRDYAVEVTLRSRYIPGAMFERLRQHFSEAQIVELTIRTALAGFFNRVNEALRIEMEDGVIELMLSRGGKLEDLPTPAAPIGG